MNVSSLNITYRVTDYIRYATQLVLWRRVSHRWNYNSTTGKEE